MKYLNIDVIKLSEFPKNYNGIYSKDIRDVIFEISPDDAKKINSVVPGACVEDTFIYYDVPRYFSENEYEGQLQSWDIEEYRPGQWVITFSYLTDNGIEDDTAAVELFERFHYDNTFIAVEGKVNTEKSGTQENLAVPHKAPAWGFYTKSDLKNILGFFTTDYQYDLKSIEDDEIIHIY